MRHFMISRRLLLIPLLALLFTGMTHVSPSLARASRADSITPGKIAYSFGKVETEGQLAGLVTESHLYLINADGSDKKRVTQKDIDVTEEHPSFSPDGAKIAFNTFSQKTFTNTAYVINVDGSGLEKLPIGDAIYLHWSPDGNALFYIQLKSLSPQNASVFTFADKSSKVIADYTGGGPQTAPTSWFPDGKSIVMNSSGYDYSLAPLDGSAPTKFPSFMGGVPFPLEFSPDGKQFAGCLTYNGADKGGIVVASWPADNMLKPIIVAPIEKNQRCDPSTASIVWSPDGTHVAYNTVFSGEDGGFAKAQIDVVDVASKQVTTIVETTDIAERIFGLDWGADPAAK